MTVRSSAGSTLGITATAPTTFNAAGYGAGTFVSIGEITDLGEFGREYNLITHNAVNTRITKKLKGSYNEGQMALQLGLDTDDAGQILAKAASLSDADYYFKLTTQNGDVYYFPAQVMSFKVGVGSVDQITTAAITLELTSAGAAGVGVVEVLAP